MSARDWLPDWRDAHSYPRADELSHAQWAWEFMRRSAGYQADYQRSLATTNYAKTHRGEFDDAPAALVGNCDPAALEGESVAQYMERLYSERKRGRIDYVPYCFRSEYLTGDPLPDPSQNEQLPWFWGPQCSRLRSGAVDELSDQNRFVLSINLDEPAEPQFVRARRMFDREHQLRGTVKKRRNHFSKYPLYLRILDADSAGASRKEMAAELFAHSPNEYPIYQANNRANDTLKAARAMREGGYRELIYQHESRRK
ncbi:MAG: DUF2285 domain-containing protein [Nitrococcus sp.]|nr:DUF2285 domain-containing protein [Nitrococcus sp.]